MTPSPFLRRVAALKIVTLFAFSLTPYVPLSIRVIDLPSHFVLQYAIGAVLLGFVALWLRMKHRFLYLLGAAFILNMVTLAPYIDRNTPAATAAKSFKVLQVNTLYLNKNTKPLQALIEKEAPDIITAVEVNDTFADMLKTLAGVYPYQSTLPQNRNARGLAVLSKIPLEDKSIILFSETHVPAQAFSVLIDGRMVDFLSLHPFTPIRTLDKRDADLRAAAKNYAAPHRNPLVITGDFNATPWSPIMKQFTATTGLRHARENHGLLPSWPVWLPFSFLRIPIDHIFVSPEIKVLDYRLGDDIGSDHLPTIGVFKLENAQHIEK